MSALSSLGTDVVPGTPLADRWRVAGTVGRVPGGLLVNALDERLRRRVRVLVAPVWDARRAALADPMLPVPLATESVAPGPAAGATLVAYPFWEGAPLALPDRPVADAPALRAWSERCCTVLELLERLHGATGRAHGHLSVHSFWRLPDGRLVLLDVATEAAPDPRFAYPDDDATDPRADIYAAAALFHALATGGLPVGDATSAPVAHRLLRSPPSEALPAPVFDVLRTALQKQPHHRFASAARMRAALRQAVDASEGRPVDPRTAPERVPVSYRLAPAPSSEPPTLERTLEPEVGTVAPARGRRHARPRPPESMVSSALVLVGGALLSLVAWTGLAGLVVAIAHAW